MSDPKLPPGVDLAWMPKLTADEYEREVTALCALRLMLAGLAIRHTMEPVNRGLQADIAAIQVALQQSIDRMAEAATELRRLAQMIEGQSGSKPEKDTVH